MLIFSRRLGNLGLQSHLLLVTSLHLALLLSELRLPRTTLSEALVQKGILLVIIVAHHLQDVALSLFELLKKALLGLFLARVLLYLPLEVLSLLHLMNR